jgi:CheY-like chemotaxis protein
MVKLLVELHGGVVAVESSVGVGSCFTVWLPFRRADDFVPTPIKPVFVVPAEASVDARVALVVEDDEKSADLIRVQLEAEGFTVLHAPTAEVGLQLALEHKLSLITLDIMLPNMDGWELLGRIKQLPSLSHVPVVIISIVADASKGFALGASVVMQKPISRQELYHSLVELGMFPVAPQKTLRILVVDDDPKAVELLAIQMKEYASEVLQANGGREAIEIAQRDLPDLIMLDLMMPDVSGFDVVAALQDRRETARIPVVVVTSKPITAADRRRLNGYVLSIVNKASFDSSRFIGEVRRATTGRRVEA